MEALRKELHLSQREFAGLIGVSHVVISLYEKGDRKLPREALKRILALQAQLHSGEPSAPEAPIKVTPAEQRRQLKLAETLRMRFRKAEITAEKLQENLTEMQQRHQYLLQKQKILQQLAGLEGAEQPVLNKILVNIVKALEGCGTASQSKLIYKIAVAQARRQIAQLLLDDPDWQQLDTISFPSPYPTLKAIY
ncbi:helix-turn-helix domain-containing protein [Niabella sp. W65]|nr:helix-turn-helix domain-containing protein [Niabella sp. W65]MCH7365478.1 helix-turn-helix domain-containing protein [Niabella sp. W65]ULT41266.1 helix-turn-helix domain-containing protein [Niabella sp. I65]